MKYDPSSQFHRRHLATAIVSSLMDAGYERNNCIVLQKRDSIGLWILEYFIPD